MRTYRGLAVTEEHRELAESARAVLADRDAIGAARAAADGASAQGPAGPARCRSCRPAADGSNSIVV